jgi:hypothetical protein
MSIRGVASGGYPRISNPTLGVVSQGLRGGNTVSLGGCFCDTAACTKNAVQRVAPVRGYSHPIPNYLGEYVSCPIVGPGSHLEVKIRVRVWEFTYAYLVSFRLFLTVWDWCDRTHVHLSDLFSIGPK